MELLMSLRELIKQKHDEAENHRFVKYLFGGNISKKVYADYLYNQSIVYKALEDRANHFGILDTIKEIQRYDSICQDIKGIRASYHNHRKYDSTFEYVSYVSDLPSERILPHVYVRHMGDMFGGAILKKIVPGNGIMYDFENRSELIAKLRSMLNDDMSLEANIVFDYAIRLYEELSIEHNIR